MRRYFLTRIRKALTGIISAYCLLALPIPAWAQQAPSNNTAERAAPCFACHGKEGQATSDGSLPRIAGKPAGYLFNQLANFRDGRRNNAQMTYMVGYMSDRNLREFADYFAGLHPPYPAPQAPNLPAAELERGRLLVLQGDKTRSIPACVACHGERLTGTQPSIPGLAGLSRGYLAWQFGSWKDGHRSAAAPDCMARIARSLTPQDIGAATAWIASQRLPDDMSAAPAGAVKPPIPCGSYTETP
ncbi:MAG TPA: cytochrome c4 [Burkholderiaceae bacterium]